MAAVTHDDAEAVATITKYQAEVAAFEQEADDDGDFAIDSAEVWVDGLPWLLWLHPDGWEAQPVHEVPAPPGLLILSTDDRDGEYRHIGGPNLTSEAIVQLLRGADRTPEYGE